MPRGLHTLAHLLVAIALPSCGDPTLPTGVVDGGEDAAGEAEAPEGADGMGGSGPSDGSNVPDRGETGGGCPTDALTVRACIRAVDGQLPEDIRRDGYAATGTVEAIHRGANGCRSPTYSMDAWTVLFDDGTRTLELRLELPWPNAIVQAGQALQVEYSEGLGYFTFGERSLIVRRDTGDLLLWVAEGDGVESLISPPEVTITPGRRVCVDGAPCGTWELLDLDAVADGSTSSVPHGETASVGAYEIAHGGVVRQLTATGCADWSVSRFAMGAVRASAVHETSTTCGGLACTNAEVCEIDATLTCADVPSAGVCAGRPTACAPDCPGTCGCDGNFYCSECEARASGVTPAPTSKVCFTQAPLRCGTPSGTTQGGVCTFTWPCDRDYVVRCEAATGTCTCSIDGVEIGTGTAGDAGTPCNSRRVLDECGLPEWIPGL